VLSKGSQDEESHTPQDRQTNPHRSWFTSIRFPRHSSHWQLGAEHFRINYEQTVNAGSFSSESNPNDKYVVQQLGTELGFITHNSSATYNNFAFKQDRLPSQIAITYSSAGAGGKVAFVGEDYGPDRKLGVTLGEFDLPNTGGWNSYRTETFTLPNDFRFNYLRRTVPLRLDFKNPSASSYLFNIASFKISSVSTTPTPTYDQAVRAIDYSDESHPDDIYNVRKMESDGTVGYIKAGSSIVFNQFDVPASAPIPTSMTIMYSSGGAGGTVKIVSDALNSTGQRGVTVGEFALPNTGGWGVAKIVEFPIPANSELSNLKGSAPLRLLFNNPNNSGYLFNLNYFRFNTGGVPPTTATPTTVTPTTVTPTTITSTTVAPTTVPPTTVAPTTTVVPPSAVSRSFSATTANFPNQERGFYGFAGHDFVTQYDANMVQQARDTGWRLVRAGIKLDQFRTSDLTPEWLAAFDTSLGKIRSAGMKVTVSMSYDFSSGGNDATAAQIKRHLEQLQPVLAKNADVIPFMNAGFIGSWGEWHGSKNGNSCGYKSTTPCDIANANRVIVRDALFANVPATTQLSFRYPKDLRLWFPSPTQQQRAGMANDCFLAGVNDSGTYGDPGSREYAQALSLNTAFGGETCSNADKPLRDTCPDILKEGREYHVTWLNGRYAETFVGTDGGRVGGSWRAGGCYDEVSRSLGYRLQLDQISHPAVASKGTVVPISVDVRNVGWSRIFSNRPLVVTLKHVATGTPYRAAASNLRDLGPQATASTRIELNVSIPADARPGEYQVTVSAPDAFTSLASDPRYSVRFANADNPQQGQAWDEAAGVFKTGTTVSVN
jgi:Domain of unknown function (DUF4832)/Domain of unknown function (DUF4874)/Carbohydrate binding module (family 6)